MRRSFGLKQGQAGGGWGGSDTPGYPDSELELPDMAGWRQREEEVVGLSVSPGL